MNEPANVPEWPEYVRTPAIDGKWFYHTSCRGMQIRTAAVETEVEGKKQLAECVPMETEFGWLPPVLADDIRRHQQQQRMRSSDN